jgi:hypothetical protein
MGGALPPAIAMPELANEAFLSQPCPQHLFIG